MVQSNDRIPTNYRQWYIAIVSLYAVCKYQKVKKVVTLRNKMSSYFLRHYVMLTCMI